MTEISEKAPPGIDTFRTRALIVGVIGIVGAIIGFVVDRDQFFKSYLLAYMFWFGLTMGSMGLLMIQHLSGGAWGMMIRRICEASTRVIPLVAIFSLVLIAGMKTLYIWADESRWTPEERTIIQHKAAYLNPTFFVIRLVIYFVVWFLISRLLNKYSKEQDATGNRHLTRSMAKISGPGIVVTGILVTLATIDWVMSLDPTWYSTIWGILFIGGQLLSAMAFCITVLAVLSKREPLAGHVLPVHFHDLGKLTLAFVLLWAYFSVSQFLIIWSGNIPEETKWYARRLDTSWKVVGLVLVLFHFALPYLVLLSRKLKRDSRRLIWLAVWIIVMRYVDLYWLMGPELHPAKEGVGTPFTVSILDIVMWFAIGGIWLWWWAGELKKRPLLPLRDPFLEDALHPTMH
jgi:hypothetical protein